MNYCIDCKNGKVESEKYIRCKKCRFKRNKYMRNYYKNNPTYRKELNKRVNEWRNKPENKLKVIQYKRNWRYRNPEKMNEMRRGSYAKNKEHYKKKEKEYLERARKERKARTDLTNAIISGKLIRPKIKCEHCGDTNEKLFYHHPNYNKSFEVIILCNKCHNEIHNKRKQPTYSYQPIKKPEIASLGV